MKIAIMQPYFYPYISYFQLIYAVDKFVVFDDVNFIKKGWINRNNILIQGKANLFSLPIKDLSQHKKINDTYYSDEIVWKEKLLQNIQFNYKKAPFFNDVFEWLEKAILNEEMNVSKYNLIQIQNVCNYLNIKTTLISSSSIYNNIELNAEDRIIDICLKEEATAYFNPIGGLELYNKSNFEAKGLALHFIQSNPFTYLQFKDPYVPYLSIIDTLMFKHHEEITEHLLPNFSLK